MFDMFSSTFSTEARRSTESLVGGAIKIERDYLFCKVWLHTVVLMWSIAKLLRRI